MSPQNGGAPCPENRLEWHLVRDEDEQELQHTASRRTGPRRWIERVLPWLISAGFHPKANATTLRVAEDLTTRMNFDTGHAVYDLNGTAARLRLGRATVKRHIRYLRELGALVWVSHGSQRNSRRDRGLEGYAGTATVYAAVVPPVYDHAMGHTLVGSGYTARVIVDNRGKAPRKPVDIPAPRTGREPLSLTGVEVEGQVQMVGGVTTTGEPVADSTPTSPHPKKASSKPRKKRRTILGATVTATGLQLGDRLARALRRRFPWLRRASHDQLRWICADMGERGWTEQQAVQFASDAAAVARGAGLTWQPDRPHAILAAHLREREQQHLTQQRSTAGLEPMDNAAWDAVWGAAQEPAVQRPAEGYTDADRRDARLYGWQDFAEVADHYAEDPDDAIDLYGTALCVAALNQTRREAFV